MCRPENLMEYTGYKTIRLDTNEQCDFYESLHSNSVNDTIGCVTNEYLIIENQDCDVIDQYRFDGDKFIQVPFKCIATRFCGKIKPRNVHQQLAIDMLYRPDITIKMIAGRYGTGKDLLMASAAIDLLEREQVGKIVYVRNNIEVKDSKPIGHLPGSSNDKLLPYAMVLADKLGGVEMLQKFIDDGRIEIQHLGFLRGRDLRDSIVYCSEAENMTKEHIQLLIGRIGEGSSLWINGDCRQTDMKVFEDNSGMKAAIDKLRGHPRFGYVKLVKTERSETAAMADLLD